MAAGNEPGAGEHGTALTSYRMFFNLLASLVTAVVAPAIVDAVLAGGASQQQGYPIVATGDREQGGTPDAFAGHLAHGRVQRPILLCQPDLHAKPGQVAFVPVLAVLAGILVSTAHVLPDAMFPDAIEWDELRTRQRREGIHYAALLLCAAALAWLYPLTCTRRDRVRALERRRARTMGQPASKPCGGQVPGSRPPARGA